MQPWHTRFRTLLRFDRRQSRGRRRRENRESGVALFTVLALVALMLVLITAIFALSRTELKSSHAYAESLRAKQMADLSINLVMSQVRQGTRQNPEIGGRERWASQPGAIRSYAENGRFVAGFRLYSSPAMVLTEETVLARDRPPQDWNSDANRPLFVDLNRPLLRGEEAFFPIVDPRALQREVEGFEVDTEAVEGIVTAGERDVELRLPMPVRWLYVLRDGTLGHLADGSLAFVGAKKPTAENPIVGRIAFWADDESSKINVNTASEPTPWDTPRAINKDDMDYGRYQPAKNEFQRYPGHPSTTALGPVLFPGKGDSLEGAKKEALYSVLPRVVQGGTASGQQRAGWILQPDEDRLFATVDEFVFLPDRKEVTTRLPDLSLERVRESRFFLTARSRALELNPLGQPKVGIWPVWSEESRRTAYDHLAAFCSSLGDHYYGFQRFDSRTAFRDWVEISRNREVYDYLVRGMSRNIPGYGDSLASRWEEDVDQVITQAVDYLRSANLREKAVPVSSPGGRPQLYASNGQVVPLRIEENGTMGFGRFFTFTEFGLHFICNGHGEKGLEPPDDEDPLGENERLIQASFLMEPFSAAQGWPRLFNDFTVRVTGLDGFGIGEDKLEFPASAQRTPGNLGGSWHGRNWGGPMGIRTFIGNTGNGYPFLSQRIRVRGDTMEFKGGELQVEIYQGRSVDPANLVQTIHLEFPNGTFPVPELVEEGTTRFRGGGGTSASYWWDFGGRYRQTTRVPHSPGDEYADRLRRWPPDRSGNSPGFKIGGVFRAEDVVRTLVPWHGDYRLLAARHVVAKDLFRPPTPDYNDTGRKLIHLFNDTQGTHLLYGFSNEPGLTSPGADGVQLTDADYHYSRLPDVPVGTGAANRLGDFDNGVAQIHDGAYINRPDEGNYATKGQYAYFAWNYSEPREQNFSPNRILPSPGMLGSLPVGVKRGLPWQTLLFRPQEGHPGAEDPPDHLFLEYLWMPVIEPYAISEPFSTAGKVNLNYRLMPFDYITRSTGLAGIFRSEKPLAVPNEMSRIYKLWDHETSDHPWLPDQARGNLDSQVMRDWSSAARGGVPMRKSIDREKTLAQFEEKFDAGELFRYPSEICSIHLVREGESLSDYRSGQFWARHLVTGDNVRERPYTNLYPRLTTQSNTYRVHFWAEAVQKARHSDPEVFDPLVDVVTGRYRGSALIERYIDPEDPDLPDFADPASETLSLDPFVQMRIIETKRFSP